MRPSARPPRAEHGRPPRTGLGARGKRSPAVAASHSILESTNYSLREVAQTPVEWLARLPNVGIASAAAGHAALELARRLRVEPYQRGTPIRSARTVAAPMAPQLEDIPVCECHLLLLDRDWRLDRVVLLSRGTINATLLHPREVFREALRAQASAIMLVRNRPSGDPTPSLEDRVLTLELAAGGLLLGIPVLDHVVIGRGRYVSFVEARLLPSVEELVSGAESLPVPARVSRARADVWHYVVREAKRPTRAPRHSGRMPERRGTGARIGSQSTRLVTPR
jgi:DNA repair protein RadC